MKKLTLLALLVSAIPLAIMSMQTEERKAEIKAEIERIKKRDAEIQARITQEVKDKLSRWQEKPRRNPYITVDTSELLLLRPKITK